MAGISKERRKELEQLESDTTKLCLDCGKIKPLFEFGVRSGGRKFSRSRCLSCDNEVDLQRRFGITFSDYDKIFKKQNGKCKICGNKEIGHKLQGRFCVDHDHSTGKIRGLLCYRCNLLLGNAKDNIEILASAIQYLIDSRK